MKTLFRIASIGALLAAALPHAYAQRASDPPIVRGQQIYSLHCVNCHGISGIPTMPDTPNLAMRQGMDQPDIMLMNTIKHGKFGKSTAMPPNPRLSDQDILDVILYIRTSLR